MTLEPQYRPADDKGYGGRQGHTDRQAAPGRQAEPRRPDRHRVGPDGEEAGVTQAHHAGVTHEDVQTHGGQREDADHGEEPEMEIGSRHEGQQAEHGAKAKRRRMSANEGVDPVRHAHKLVFRTIRWGAAAGREQ